MDILLKLLVFEPSCGKEFICYTDKMVILFSVSATLHIQGHLLGQISSPCPLFIIIRFSSRIAINNFGRVKHNNNNNNNNSNNNNNNNNNNSNNNNNNNNSNNNNYGGE